MGQALLYGLFALIIGTFSGLPTYRHLPADQALIKLSFSHQGGLVSPCRERSAQELAQMAPNMRNPLDCPRERSPVSVEIDLDGATVYRQVATPSGLSKDGASSVYHRLPVRAGEHRLAVRVKDDAREQGFNYRREEIVTLQPGKVLVIDFNPSAGGITLQ